MLRNLIYFLSALPIYGAIQVGSIIPIPAESGQRVLSFKTDSAGNLITAGTIAADVFVRKSGPSGISTWERRLPGVDGGAALPLAVDGNGDIYVAGSLVFAAADAFPFTGILLTSTAHAPAFVMKLHEPDGTIAWADEIDGVPTAITVDPYGESIVAVRDFPQGLETTPGAYDSHPGASLGWATSVIRISANGDKAVFALRYGGTLYLCYTGSGCASSGANVTPSAVMLDGQGHIWIAGSTDALDLPVTKDAFSKTCGCSLGGGGDGFLAKFSADGSALLYATYFGSAPSTSAGSDGGDFILSAVFDSAGHIWMAGLTNGAGLPVVSGHKASPAGVTSWFLADFDPTANIFPVATYFGTVNDAVTGLLAAPGSTLILEGSLQSTADLPAPPTGFRRGADFVALFDTQGNVLSATTFPAGAADAGLALSSSGAPMVAGSGNVAAVLDTAGTGGPSVYGVTSSAGVSATGQVSPGELISLYGAEIGPAAPVAASLIGGAFPKGLAGAQVLVNGKSAPIIYASADQINGIVPFGIDPAAPLDLVVTNGAATSNHASLLPMDAIPEAFKENASGQAAALNQDGSRNDRKPAAPGSIVQVFGTGFGAMHPQPADGAILSGTLPALALPVQVLYNGQPLHVTYAGPAPSLVAGAIQVNFRLPQIPPSGPTEAFQFQVGSEIGSPFVLQVQQ